MTNEADTVKANTDRVIIPETLFITKEGAIGINCGGHVVVKTPAAWHALARLPHEAEGKADAEAVDAGLELPARLEKAVRAFEDVTGKLASPSTQKAIGAACAAYDEPLSASPSSLPDPGVAETWKAIREAIELCAGEVPGEYSFYTPAKACKAALEWAEFLEFAGAAAPKILPGDDGMTLTWGSTPLPKFYLTITEEGDASVYVVPKPAASLKGGQ